MLPTFRLAEQFAWACENQPDLYGFSHFSRVKWRPNTDGSKTAESIIYVHRVDLVADPATTSGVYESTQVPTMTLDAKSTAALIVDAATLESFLMDVLANLPPGIDAAAKLAAVEKLMAGMDTAAVEGESAESVAIAALNRRGKAAQWAAQMVKESIDAKKAAKRKADAVALCRAEGLPDALMQDVFVELVAESISNSTRAKALIADRKSFSRPGEPTPVTGSGSPISPPPAPSPKRSAADLVADLKR